VKTQLEQASCGEAGRGRRRGRAVRSLALSHHSLLHFHPLQHTQRVRPLLCEAERTRPADAPLLHAAIMSSSAAPPTSLLSSLVTQANLGRTRADFASGLGSNNQAIGEGSTKGPSGQGADSQAGGREMNDSESSMKGDTVRPSPSQSCSMDCARCARAEPRRLGARVEPLADVPRPRCPASSHLFPPLPVVPAECVLLPTTSRTCERSADPRFSLPPSPVDTPPRLLPGSAPPHPPLALASLPLADVNNEYPANGEAGANIKTDSESAKFSADGSSAATSADQ